MSVPVLSPGLPADPAPLPVVVDWSASVSFVPEDPPRSSTLACWSEDALGLFAPSGEGNASTLDVVLPGRPPRRTAVPAQLLPMGVAVAALLGPLPSDASPAARWWAASLRFALDLIARGHIVPTVTLAGWDAWQVDPLEPGDYATLEQLAAACPAAAHAIAAPGSTLDVADPVWLLRCFLDAVADVFVRTAAAPAAVGTHLFAATEPSPAEHVRSWLLAAFGHATSAIRLGLRVELVAGRSDDPTTTSFEVVPQVRSTADPSLVVDAADLTADLSSDLGSGSSLAGRLGSSASTEVLVAIGRAARVWPALDASLDGGIPQRLSVTVDELDALLDAAAELEATGVEVLWPTELVADMRTRLVATAPPPSVGRRAIVGLGSILDFRWEVLCDGSPLTDLELDTLADAKRSLVWMRGRWIRTDDEVVRRIRALPPGLDGPTGLAAALAGELVDANGEVIEVAAAGFAETLRSQFGSLAGLREEPEPEGLATDLRPYQRRGVAWMLDLCSLGLGGVLADDMGLGKTVQVIAMHLCRSVEGDGAPLLVVCPTSVLGNWAREFARFAPDVPVRRLVGPDRHLESLEHGEVVLCTYGVMRRMADDLAEVGWSTVVADEAQAIKNPRSRTSRALRRIGAPARLALTGTPVENRLSELWALLDWTTPGLLGSAESFRANYAAPIERHGNRYRSEHLATLTKPFMLRRRKTDPAVEVDLPPRIQHDVIVPLGDEQLTMYEALVRESLFRINGSEGATRVGMVFKLLTGLKQIANHPGQYLHEQNGPLAGRSGKLEAAVELVGAAVDGDERVLVFSQYVEMCHLLRRRFEDVGIATEVLHGGLSAVARDRLVARFQAGEIPVLVISLKAGGTGLNLTAATQVVHFDRWWNPAVEDQATDRAWRLGQTRPVVVHRLIAEGTIDERIAEMIERKRSLADRVVGGGETWIADLSDEELSDLVSLHRGELPLRAASGGVMRR